MNLIMYEWWHDVIYLAQDRKALMTQVRHKYLTKDNVKLISSEPISHRGTVSFDVGKKMVPEISSGC